MPSFCNCKLCQKIRKEAEFPKCPYCGKHHDSRLGCFEFNRLNQHKLTEKNLKNKKDISEKTKTAIVTNTQQNHEYKIDLENGKYTVYLQNKPYEFKALRYNEEWRDLCGDNLIMALVQKIIRLTKIRTKAAKLVPTNSMAYILLKGKK